MVRLNLNNHEELETDLKRFISALLPHEQGDSSYFSLILEQVIRLIHIDELEGEYFLILTVANQLNKIAYATGVRPTFTRAVLISVLEAQLYDIVSVDGQGFSRMMTDSGKRGDNLKDVDACHQAASEALKRCVCLYDEAYEMKVSPEDAMGFVVSMRSNYKAAVIRETLAVQGELAYNTFDLAERKWEPWRKTLSKKGFAGSDGWLDFIGYVHSMLSRRLRESETELRPLTTVDEANRLKEDVLERTAALAEYGIPPIDAKRPIMKTRYVVLIGKPNLGKTTIAVNWLVNVFLQGKKVAIFSEETPESSMLYEYIMPVYIYKKYGFFASYEQIVGEDEVGGVNAQEAEERKKMIKMAICDVAESGNYLYVPLLNAWNIYDDLARVRSEFPFDYLVIDHTLSVHGGGETTPRLNALSSGIKRFKNDHKISVCLLSHPSPHAKKVVSRSGASGLTKYSTQIEGDADDVFYMFDTPELEARNLIGLIHTKGRGASKMLDIVYLTKMFEIKYVKYDPEMQLTHGGENGTMMALDLMSHEDEDEDYDIDDF